MQKQWQWMSTAIRTAFLRAPKDKSWYDALALSLIIHLHSQHTCLCTHITFSHAHNSHSPHLVLPWYGFKYSDLHCKHGHKYTCEGQLRFTLNLHLVIYFIQSNLWGWDKINTNKIGVELQERFLLVVMCYLLFKFHNNFNISTTMAQHNKVCI